MNFSSPKPCRKELCGAPTCPVHAGLDIILGFAAVLLTAECAAASGLIAPMGKGVLMDPDSRTKGVEQKPPNASAGPADAQRP